MTLALHGKSRRRQVTLLALALFAVFAAIVGGSQVLRPFDASAASNAATAGSASGWTNSSNAIGGDGGGAATATGDGQVITLSNFGLSVPSGATITDITVLANLYNNDSGTDCNAFIRVARDGSGGNYSSNFDTGNLSNSTSNTESAGGLWGQANWTAAQTNSIQVQIETQDDGSSCDSSSTWSLDYVQVTVTYGDYLNVGATVNGLSQVTVTPGATVSVEFTVNLLNESGSDWDSTQWDFNDATPDNCENKADSSADGVQSHTFNIMVPNSPGTYDLMLRASSSSSNCNNDSGQVFTLVDAVIVQTATVDDYIEQLIDHNGPSQIPDGVCASADFNFIVDTSGSVDGDEMTAVKNAMTGFATNYQNGGGSGLYAITTFGDGAATNLTAGFVNQAGFNTGVAAIPAFGTGFTPTSLGISTGLANSANDRGGVGNIMFIITDGSPNQPDGGLLISNPDRWVDAANLAIGQANTARGTYHVIAAYVGTPDPLLNDAMPGDQAEADAFAEAVMTQLGGGTFISTSFADLANDLLIESGCEPEPHNLTILKSDANGAVPMDFTMTIEDDTPAVLDSGAGSATAPVTPGETYHIFESDEPGWTLAAVECQDGEGTNVPYEPNNSEFARFLPIPEDVVGDVTCIFTNRPETGTLVILKWVWDGDSWEPEPVDSDRFTFTADGTTDYPGLTPGSHVLPVGIYNVSETVIEPGYHLVKILGAGTSSTACVPPDNQDPIDPALDESTVGLLDGETKYICAWNAPDVTPTRDVEVCKLVIENGDDVLDGDGFTWRFDIREAPAVQVLEAGVGSSGVEDQEISCSDTYQVSTEIPVEAVEWGSRPGNWNGDAAGYPQWAIEVDGVAFSSGSGSTTGQVPAGDDPIRFIFSNQTTPRNGDITIEKFVWDGDSWEPWVATEPFGFEILPLDQGGTATHADVPPGGPYEVIPGAYQVGEHDPSADGYALEAIFEAAETCPEAPVVETASALVLDGDSTNVDVAAGETVVVCAYNAPIGQLIINKVNNTDDGPFTFDINVNGGDFDTVVGGAAPGQTEVYNEVVPFGTYSVAELGVATFEQCPAEPGAPAGTPYQLNPTPVQVLDQPGETITFTITNSDCPSVLGTGTLVVEKFQDLDGTPGPEDTPLSWTVTVTGPEFPGGQSFVLDGANPSSPALGVLFLPGIAVGPYTVTEATVATYNQTGLIVNGVAQGVNDTAGVVVALNDTATVEFYNQPTGAIRVEKSTYHNNSVVDDRDGWTITVSGCGYFDAGVTGADGVVEFDNIPACNSVTVSENPNSKPGYTPTGGAVKVVAVTAGNTTTVTFRNDSSDTPGPTPTPTTPGETPTPTATTPGETPTTGTPTPTEEVAGEITPGPGTGSEATPIAPSAGTGTAGATNAVAMMLVVMGLFAISSGATVLAVARRRN